MVRAGEWRFLAGRWSCDGCGWSGRSPRLIELVVAAVALVGSTMLVGPSIVRGSPPPPSSPPPGITSISTLNSPSFGGGGTVAFGGYWFSEEPGGTKFFIGLTFPCQAPCVEVEDVVCSSPGSCLGTFPPFPGQPRESCEVIRTITPYVHQQLGRTLNLPFTWGDCPPQSDGLADTGGTPPIVIGLVAASALLAGSGLLRLSRRRLA